MRDLVYGFGGTGVKCLEALTHLCAAGMLPTEHKLALRVVDQDFTNGNTIKALQLISAYGKVRTQLRGAHDLTAASSLFGADLTTLGVATANGRDNAVLSVATDQGTSIADAYRLAEHPDLSREGGKGLLRALFLPSELDQNVAIGFQGRPAIGSVTLHSPRLRSASSLWRQLEADLPEVRRGSRVILVGSIFGGTGASCVPTIARWFREQLATKGGLVESRPEQIVVVLLLRYFDVDRDTPTFGPNALEHTPAALRHYRDLLSGGTPGRAPKRAPDIDSLYLVGLSPELMVPAEDQKGGGPTQLNPPLFPELLAGLAVVDALTQHRTAGANGQTFVCAREKHERITWSDLPFRSDTQRVSLQSAIRFFLAYAYAYHATDSLSRAEFLEDLPAYTQHLDIKSLRNAAYDGVADDLKRYALSFLTWLVAIQTCAQTKANGTDTTFGLHLIRPASLLADSTAAPTFPFTLDPLPGGHEAARAAKAAFLDFVVDAPERSLASVLVALSAGGGTRRSFGRFIEALADATRPRR